MVNNNNNTPDENNQPDDLNNQDANQNKESAEKNANITHHGWANMETIKEKLQDMDYCLMTSTILETF